MLLLRGNEGDKCETKTLTEATAASKHESSNLAICLHVHYGVKDQS